MWCVSLSRIYGAVNWHIGTLPDWHIISLFHSVSKQYPYPRRVTIRLPYMPIFLRRRVMLTSIVRSSTYTSSLHTRARMSSRENTRPLFCNSRNRISNSFLVSATSSPSMLTFFFVNVDYQRLVSDLFRCFFGFGGNGTPQNRFYACYHFTQGERLRDIVVRTEVKAGHRIISYLWR